MKSFLHCAHCERMMQMRSAKIKIPGAVVAMSSSTCTTCAARIKLGVPLPGHDYDCAECGVRVDTSYDGGGPRPASGGVCRRCRISVAAKRSNQERGESDRSRVTYVGRVCAGTCGRVLRPKSEPARPGTIRYRREGFCDTCYKAAATQPVDTETLPVEKAVAQVYGLGGFMADREARRAKQQRVKKARAYEYARWVHNRKKTRQPA